MVDFSDVPADWFNKVGHWDFTTGIQNDQGLQDLEARAERATAFLCDRTEEDLVVVGHHTLFAHLVSVEFFNCEVMEFELSQTGPWRERWSVARSDGTIVDLYKPNGDRWTWTGSPPLKGTLKTCVKMSHLGPNAAAVTAVRAGIPYP